ncbi:MAG TPA: hypothetical protein VGL59_03595, partial [Polyangia bacterium]
ACSSSSAPQTPSGGAGGAGAGSGGASGSGGAAPGSGSGGIGSGGAPVDSAAAVDAGAGGAAVDAPPAVDQAADHAGADAGSSPCVPGALLCEDFEGYAVGPSLAPTWMTDNMGGTLQVDTTRPFAGTKSVHFTATVNVGNLLQIWKQGAPLFPIKNNTFYGRVMMWLSRQPTGEVHFNTVQANGMLPGSNQIAKYAYGAMNSKLMAGYTIRATEADLPTVDCGKSTGTTGYPVGKWVCAEWEFDGANDVMHYWLDSVAQTAVDLVKTDPSCGMTPPPGNEWKAPTFNKLMLGWYSQAYAMPVELWMDDVVISTERVGCPKAP